MRSSCPCTTRTIRGLAFRLRPMDRVLDSLDTFWRLGVKNYSLGGAEMLMNAVYSFTGRPRREVSDASGHGRSVVVTGANSGIGKATAAALYDRGWNVLLACRSLDKARAAVEEMGNSNATHSQSSSGPRPWLRVQQLDLNSLGSVQHFCQALDSLDPQPSLLICNAGVMAPEALQVTEDGMEAQFQGNYLGHFLLARHLAARRIEHAQSRAAAHKAPQPTEHLRVVFLSSCVHVGGKIKVHSLPLPRPYNGLQAYANSKLCSILAAKEFQRRVERLGPPHSHQMSFCAVHPGLVDTGLAHGWLLGTAFPAVLHPLLRALLPRMLISTQQAVQAMLFASCSPAQQVAGEYIVDSQVARPSKAALHQRSAMELWDISLTLTKAARSSLD